MHTYEYIYVDTLDIIDILCIFLYYNTYYKCLQLLLKQKITNILVNKQAPHTHTHIQFRSKCGTEWMLTENLIKNARAWQDFTLYFISMSCASNQFRLELLRFSLILLSLNSENLIYATHPRIDIQADWILSVRAYGLMKWWEFIQNDQFRKNRHYFYKTHRSSPILISFLNRISNRI